jgi:serine/threonine protein kinase
LANNSAQEIASLIGKGGMGEVYRARDKQLKRDVAIKILPEEFSRDTDRVSRFQREAEALAALNYQNIAGIYDLQQSDATRFLILEFVEGDTLADILKKRGTLPVDESLYIAKQICAALEAAHEQGIIHRDLKPANVKVTSRGQAKVLDFGLARSWRNDAVSQSNSPTMLSSSEPGMIVGTAAYMSPEQVKGKEADRHPISGALAAFCTKCLRGARLFKPRVQVRSSREFSRMTQSGIDCRQICHKASAAF